MTDSPRPSWMFVVEAGHIAMFLRSLGVEVGYGDSVLAPLTFTQAAAHSDPESPLRPHPGRPWRGSGRRATGEPEAAAGEGWLHAEQHFRYRRHVHAGETLHVSTRPGRTWTKQGSSAALAFAEEVTEFRGEDGETAIVSTIVRVRREPLGANS